MNSKIQTIIRAHGRLSVDIDKLGENEDLYDAGMTSHATVNVMLALENHFDIEFPDSMLSRKTFASIESIAEAVAGFLHGELPRVRGRDIERHRGGDKDGHDAHEMGQAKIACHGAPPW